MREATARCLRDTFCVNSMAHVRYLLYARRAKDENFPGISRLFRALAMSRYVRASEQFAMVNELIGTRAAGAETYFTLARTIDNMERARDAEKDDADELLPACMAVAGSQGEEAAAKSLERSAAIGRRRAALLEDVILKTKETDQEPEIASIYVCRACGYVTRDIAPEGCPICGNEKTEFVCVA
jgi:rubrerythrin